MPFIVPCQCGAKLKIPYQHAGEHAICPKCQRPVVLEPPAPRAYDAFVSYSKEDRATGEAICAALEGKGIRCWIAPRDIVPGANWGASIVEAIEHSRLMALVFSSHANQSNQVEREVERAVGKGVPIIPFRVENIEPSKALEYFLSSQHWLDAFPPPIDRHLERLAASARAILSPEAAPAHVEGRTGERVPERQHEPRETVSHGWSIALRRWLPGAGLAVVSLLLIAVVYLLWFRGAPKATAPSQLDSILSLLAASENRESGEKDYGEGAPDVKKRAFLAGYIGYHLAQSERAGQPTSEEHWRFLKNILKSMRVESDFCSTRGGGEAASAYPVEVLLNSQLVLPIGQVNGTEAEWSTRAGVLYVFLYNACSHRVAGTGPGPEAFEEAVQTAVSQLITASRTARFPDTVLAALERIEGMKGTWREEETPKECLKILTGIPAAMAGR